MSTVYIDEVPFRHNLSAAELAEAGALIQHARGTTRKMREQLRISIKLGNTGDEEHAKALLLSSQESLLIAAIRGNGKLKPKHRQSLERCLSVPDELTFDAPLNEPVPVRPEPKKWGGVRMLHNHRLYHRTGQHMILKVMGEYFQPRPFQYTMRGVPAAIAEAKKLVNAGYVFAARLDIKDFFPSFDPDQLRLELPLPKGVVEHGVVGRHMKVTMDQETRTGHSCPDSLPLTYLLLLARLGIPLGSACSPIIGAYCLSRLSWVQIDGVAIINYADDFLLLALSQKQLEKAIGELTGAVAIHPGGHFELKLKQVKNVTKGFEFLGHHLRMKGGELMVTPTEANLQDLWTRLNHLDTKAGKAAYPAGPHSTVNKKAALALLAEMLTLVEGWTGAFRECDDPTRYQAHAMIILEQWLEQLGVSIGQVKAAQDPSMAYRPSGYPFGH